MLMWWGDMASECVKEGILISSQRFWEWTYLWIVHDRPDTEQECVDRQCKSEVDFFKRSVLRGILYLII